MYGGSTIPARADSSTFPFWNIKPSNTSQLSAGIVGAKAGTSRKRILIYGDSTMYGTLADGTSVSQKILSVPYFLQQLVNANLCPADIDSFMGCAHNSTFANYTTYDPRWVNAGGWGLNAAAQDCCGGRCMFGAIIGNKATYTPGNTFDMIELGYLELSAARSMTVDVGAAPIATIVPTAGTAGDPKQVTIAVGSTASLVNLIIVATGAVNVNWMSTYTAGENKLAIMGSGIPGGLASDWGGVVTNYQAGNGLPVYAADYSFCELIINDSGQQISLASYKNSLQALVTKAKTSGGICLVIGNQTSPMFNAQATPLVVQQLRYQTIYDVAAINDLPVIDFWKWLGGWDQANTLNYQEDQSHLWGTAAKMGNQRKAQLYYEFFKRCA